MTAEPFNDIRDTLIALPHGDPHGSTAYVRSDLFTVRHELIRELRPAPTSVFEFGALYGYFLVTALDAAPSIVAVGWVDNEQHTSESNQLCDANLREYLTDRGREDTLAWHGRLRDEVPITHRYDLVSVDSDHSYTGCLADLHAAHRLNPRWIFVDDWDAETHRDDIRAAVAQFRLIDISDEYDLAKHDTVNGLAVLTRKEHA